MKLKDVTDEVFERECLKVCPDLDYQWYRPTDIIEFEGRDNLKELTVKEFVEFAEWYDREKYDFGVRMCALQDAGKSILDIYINYNMLCDVEFYELEYCDDDEIPEDIDDLIKDGIFADVGWAYVCLL